MTVGVGVGVGVDKYDGMGGGKVGIFICGRMVEINNNLLLILFCSSTTLRRTSLILLMSSSKRAACIKNMYLIKLNMQNYLYANCNTCIFTFSSNYLYMLCLQ